MGDNHMILSVIPAVDLQLKAVKTTGHGCDELAGKEAILGKYKAVGPERSISILEAAAGRTSLELEGFISPLSPVTVPAEARASAGIPMAAAAFAFVYPMSHLENALEKLNLANNPFGFLLLLGGFAYFDENHVLISSNALALIPSEQNLKMEG